MSITFKVVVMASAILAIAVSLSDWLVYKSAKELLLDSTLNQMEGTLSLEIERITREIDQVRVQAEELADLTVVQGFLYSRNRPQPDSHNQAANSSEFRYISQATWRRHLEAKFSQLIRTNDYLQVRLIDAETGMELVRVNRSNDGPPISVSDHQLQNKRHSAYVENGRGLKSGDIYISDVTLNRENNQLVSPYQPTQRVVAPVYYIRDEFISGNRVKILDLAEQLRRYDQLLTLSAMRIAQSGNLVWQNRYQQTASTLKHLLNHIGQLSTDEDSMLLKELQLIHKDLEDSEIRTIEYATQGLLQEATQVIIGRQYWAQKRHFKNTLEELILSLEDRYITTSLRRQPNALIVINTNASSLFNTLNARVAGKTILVNNRGQYIHHPETSKAWAFELNPDTPDLKIDEKGVWQALSTNQKYPLAFDTHNELHIAGKILYTHNNPDRYLGLIITQSEAAVLKPIEAFKAQSFLISIIAIVLSGFAIALFTRRELKPITTLTHQAKRISAGHEHSSLKVPGAKGEVKTMVNAFETLIQQLQQQTQEANNNANELAKLADSLEQRVISRTAELAESMEKAETASIAKSQFLATMSHEIRTPMNGVLGMAQLLANSELSEQQQYYLSTINQSGQALLSIINDILDFSKIESGKLTLDPIEFDLEHVAHDAFQLLATGAEQKGLELIFDFDVHSPRHYKGDPGRIRQILINLIGNAIKFTEKGYIRLNIYHDVTQNPALCFDVIDSGIGMTDEQQKDLFEAFTQADASTTRRYGGTGLGLTISKRLIDLMGGQIKISSELNKGTTFSFQLPLEPSQSPTQFARANLHSIKALIVDDNRINCIILEGLLKHWGLKTVTTTNPARALEALDQAQAENAPFQLVILDYLMPQCDGLTLGKDIFNRYQIPQIMLTSASGQHSPDTLREAGISICLSKPYSSKTLKNALEIALEKSNDTLLSQPRTQYEMSNPREPSIQGAKFRGKILLVEDNIVNQNVALGLLTQLGLEVDIAEDGLVALTCYKEGYYDLILMDCLMPKLDGFEATRAIRKQEAGLSRIPIIALTANVMQDDQQRCKDAGMDDFIGKPIEQDELIRKLSHWLNQAISTPDSESKFEPEPESQSSIEPPEDIPLVDNERFDHMRLQLKTHFQSIFSAYLEESKSLIDRLQCAGEDKDQNSMKIAVHSLKSSSAALGAMQLSTLAESLESLYEKGQTENWKTDVVQLNNIYQKTKQQMEFLNESHLHD